MAILRFSKWRPSAILNLENCSFCHVAIADIPFLCLIQNFAEIGQSVDRWVMAKKAIFKMAAAAILNLKKSIFGHVTVIGFNIWCSVPNFIKIGRFLTEIQRFNDFQNGGRPPSWIWKLAVFIMWPLSAWRSASAYKISLKSDNRSIDELWPKKRFSRWRPPPSWI